MCRGCHDHASCHCFREETTIEEIARLFDTRKIKRVAVTRDGRLVGLVSRADLLEVIARSKPPVIASGDDALRLSIASRLCGTFPTATPLAVSVVDGVIHLRGTLRSENERRAILVIVDSVPGGTGVEDHMLVDNDGEGGPPTAGPDDGAAR